MQDHGVYGLALANVLAAFIQTIYLITKTEGFVFLTFIQKQPLFFLPILFSSLLMGVILYLLNDWITLPAGKGSDIAKLFLFIPMGAFCYFLFCYASRVPEARSLGAKMTKSLPFGGRL
jgi:energy-coupling factor transporter transmembrane protein EcfT